MIGSLPFAAAGDAATPHAAAVARRTSRKVMLRIMPLTFLIYMINYLDRANISFAALTMGKDLALSSEAFGFASGIFFIGYLICEVPSNLALRRFGARVWLARIQISWGIVASATAWVQDAHQLYAARFLLGVAEAGLVPGLIAYYNYWFRLNQLAKTGAILGAAVPISFAVSGPLSAWIMTHVTVLHLSGWRAMLFVEGLPALVTGALTYVLLTDRPEQASWLDEEERHWLTSTLAAEHPADAAAVAAREGWRTVAGPRVLYLGFLYVLFQIGNFGIGFWMPQLIKRLQGTLSLMEVGLLSAIPYVVATLGLFVWSASSDRTGERRLHSAGALLLGAIGLAGSALTGNLWLSMALLSAALTGFYAFKSPFNVLPRLFLTRDSAAVAFAVINSIGQVGAFLGPYVFGVILAHSRSPSIALLCLAAITVGTAVLVTGLRIGRASRVANPS